MSYTLMALDLDEIPQVDQSVRRPKTPKKSPGSTTEMYREQPA